MAKDVTKTAKPAAKRASAPKKPAARKMADEAAKPAKAANTAKVQKRVEKATKVAKSPAATEIVAATLVAAAAALRDPQKAKALALSAADDLKKAAKSGADGGALWTLALDVARRSIDAVGKERTSGKKMKKSGRKKK